MCFRWDWLEATTGPVMLYNAVQVYKSVYPKMPGITILAPGVIYPIDWRRTVWGPKDGPGETTFIPIGFGGSLGTAMNHSEK